MQPASGSIPEELWDVDYLGAEFRALAEAMPQLVWAARPNGDIDYFNKRWIDYTGYDVGDPTGHGHLVVHPDEFQETMTRWEQAVNTATPYEMEYRLRRSSDGSYRWFISRAVPIFDADDRVTRWIGTATDIDEQRRAHDSLSFMVEAGNALASSLDVKTICESLAELAVGHFADWCFVSLMQDGRPNTVAMQHRDTELLHLIEEARDRYPTRPGEPMMVAIEQNQPLLVERVTRDQIEAAARDEEHLRLLNLLQMNSVMIVPLATPAGQVHGAISMISAQSGRLFNATDLNVAKAVATRAAMAIDNARIFQAERNAADRLRFIGRINQLLFETADLWATMERVANIIAVEVADGCSIVSLTGDAIRPEVVAHRNAEVQTIVAGLRGQRTNRPDSERDIAARLRRHETIVFDDPTGDLMRARVWPFLAKEIAALNAKTTVVLPLFSGTETYGAISAYYSERSFVSERDLPILEEIAARTSIAFERAETLERERKIATTLQQASLPSLIPQPEGLKFNAVYSPAGNEGEVGGDWYDAIELDDSSVVISVGDVTGRGIQAAAIMSKVRHAMGMAPLHETNPTKILDAAEWFLRKRYPDAIVTAFVARISEDRKMLYFANAGHPTPILRRGHELIELRAGGLPLGLRKWAQAAPSCSAELQEGDMLVLFTDGLIEAGRDWEQGEERLRRVLASDAVLYSASPAQLIARSCLPAEVHDDVAILTVLVGRGPIWTFTAEDARAAADARSHFVAFLRTQKLSDDTVHSAELVFGELLGNVVRHAPGPVEITLFREGETLTLHVIDSGEPFDFASRLPRDILSELGRGLFIVHEIVEDVSVEHVPNCGNHISVTL